MEEERWREEEDNWGGKCEVRTNEEGDRAVSICGRTTHTPFAAEVLLQYSTQLDGQWSRVARDHVDHHWHRIKRTAPPFMS